MFWNKCNHEWSVLATVTAQPAKINKASEIYDDTILKLMLGITTLVLTCSKCGEIDKSEVYGVPK